MANRSNETPDYGAKDLGKYEDLGRGPVTSYFRRVVAPLVPADAGTFARLAAFTSGVKNWVKWASHVMRYITSPKHPFLNYGTESGVYAFVDKSVVSVAGDWGTGTDEAQHVMTAMLNHTPDFTVHLGDVYYVGDLPEIEENCFGQDVHRANGVTIKGVKWEPGTKGSFALNGNHEMYACGTAYFERFLPSLGLVNHAGEASGQKASFFCLENKYWKVIGLDTGYNSVGVRTVLSFLSRLKAVQWLRKTTWFKPSCKLHDDLMKWLSRVLPSDSRRGDPDSETISPALILLSHHEYYSSFDDWYPIPARQLRNFILPDRPVLWFWGHEHRFAVYDRFGTKDGIQAFGRCIGHGGMPVDRGSVPDITDCNCVLYDNRRYLSKEDIDVGYNGFITLVFDGPSLDVNYYDLFNTLLLTERWTSDGRGQLRGPEFRNVSTDLKQNDPAFIRDHSGR
jgi:hypothetical protein